LFFASWRDVEMGGCRPAGRHTLREGTANDEVRLLYLCTICQHWTPHPSALRVVDQTSPFQFHCHSGTSFSPIPIPVYVSFSDPYTKCWLPFNLTQKQPWVPYFLCAVPLERSCTCLEVLRSRKFTHVLRDCMFSILVCTLHVHMYSCVFDSYTVLWNFMYTWDSNSCCSFHISCS